MRDVFSKVCFHRHQQRVDVVVFITETKTRLTETWANLIYKRSYRSSTEYWVTSNIEWQTIFGLIQYLMTPNRFNIRFLTNDFFSPTFRNVEPVQNSLGAEPFNTRNTWNACGPDINRLQNKYCFKIFYDTKCVNQYLIPSRFWQQRGDLTKTSRYRSVLLQFC